MKPDDAPAHPYRRAPPRVDVPPPRRALGLIIAAVLEAWTAAYAAVTAPATLRDYRSLFVQFGVELTGTTKALLDLPWIWAPFAVVAIAILIWVGVRSPPTDLEKKRMKLALWVFGVVFGLTAVWAGYALYSPLFRLKAVV